MRLAPGTQLEALVVSDYRSQNMELNPNVSWDKVDLGENLRTAYVESPDGRYGFRLRFAGIYENRLERGDRVCAPRTSRCSNAASHCPRRSGASPT